MWGMCGSPASKMSLPPAMHHSLYPCIAQQRPFKTPSQLPPNQRSSKEAATRAVTIPPSLKGRNQTVFIWLLELLSLLFFLFYYFLSYLFKITYTYPFEHILDVSKIFAGRCPSEFGRTLCSICKSSHTKKIHLGSVEDL